jgi:hypothetical protein
MAVRLSLALALLALLPASAPAIVHLPAVPRIIAGNPAERLLAPDSFGNAQALARRMGVEELIWDCGYWGAGMSDFTPYRPCYSKRGKLRKHVDPTIAHRDHIHIGMTKAGARARTSFWKAGR